MKRKKLPISLTLIVKNEEEYLADCLSSVHQMVKEIIIVDTGSTDKTKEIAESFGAQIFDYEWKDDFADARNTALDKATQPWILQLDADEEIFKGDLEWFYQNYPYENVDGYWMYIYNYKKNKPVMDAHPLIRFFKNKPGNRYIYRIHENLILEGRSAVSGARIFHKGYATVELDQKKADRNLKLLQKRVKEDPKDPLSHYYFAQMYAGQKQFVKASAPARKSLKLGLRMPVKGTALRIGFIGAIIEKKLNKFKEILSHCPEYKLFPDRLLYEAKFIQDSKPSQSRQLLDLYITIVLESMKNGMFGKVDYIAPDNYPIALRMRANFHAEEKNYEAALDDLNESLEYSQTNFQTIIEKAGFLIKCGRLSEAKIEIDNAIELLVDLPNQPEHLLEEYRAFSKKLANAKESIT